MLAAFALVATLGTLSATPAAVQPDASAAAHCSEYHRFGAQPVDVAKTADGQTLLVWRNSASVPVDVAKTADGQTVLAQVSWGYHQAIGCYLVLDDNAVSILRDADPPQSLPQGQTEASRQCSAFHRFGAEPVDVAKTADRQTVLARLSWGHHPTIGCFLVLDDTAIATLQTAAQPPPLEPDDEQITQPSTTNEFISISAGDQHTCGVKADNTAICWGLNIQGQSDAPNSLFTAVSVGFWHSCGIRIDKTIQCWGSNFGDKLDAPEGHFTAIAAGITHTCGIKTDNTTQCWGGDNYWGQNDAPGGHFTAITAGGRHTCGIETDNTAVCWDADGSGTAPPGGYFTAIEAGYRYTCGLRTDKTVRCWGHNAFGQADPPSGHFTAISAGARQMCGIKTDNTIQCWGDSSFFQGHAPDGEFTAVAAGGEHTCGIRTDYTVECWGNNSQGQADNPEGHFTAIEAGYNHTCGIKTDKTVQCWKAVPWPQHVQRVILGVPDAGHRDEIVAAEARMAELVNELRQSLGLAPLRYNTDVAVVARKWSQTMRNRDQFIHNPNLSQQIRYRPLSFGENIAMTSGLPLMDAVQQAFDGLVASPGHYANMTRSDFNYLGVGIAIEGSSVWFTQNFAYYH